MNRLDRQREVIGNALRTVHETEEVGLEITSELQRNREKIESARSKVNPILFCCSMHLLIVMNCSFYRHKNFQASQTMHVVFYRLCPGEMYNNAFYYCLSQLSCLLPLSLLFITPLTNKLFHVHLLLILTWLIQRNESLGN